MTMLRLHVAIHVILPFESALSATKCIRAAGDATKELGLGVGVLVAFMPPQIFLVSEGFRTTRLATVIGFIVAFPVTAWLC